MVVQFGPGVYTILVVVMGELALLFRYYSLPSV